MIAYINGMFVKENDVKISPFDRGFLFADGVYEVMRTYNEKIFKMDEHLMRLAYSLKEIRINSLNVENIKKIIDEIILRNDLKSDFNIYIQVTRGEFFPRMHAFPPKDTMPTVYATLYPLITAPNEIEKGIKILLKEDIRWKRCDIKSISLLPSILTHQSAKEDGASEAVFVRDGVVTEGTHTNFFAVKKNIVYTPPLSNFILSGITRSVILDICRENSFEIIESDIKARELKNYEEFFITGTTTEIKPVIQIDDWLINKGKPGIITRKIQNAFFKYVSSY